MTATSNIKQSTIDNVLSMLKRAKELSSLNRSFERGEVVTNFSLVNYFTAAKNLSYINKIDRSKYVCVLANPEPFHARKIIESFNSLMYKYKEGKIEIKKTSKADIVQRVKNALRDSFILKKPIVFPSIIEDNPKVKTRITKALMIMGAAVKYSDDPKRIIAVVGELQSTSWTAFYNVSKILYPRDLSSKFGYISKLVKGHTLLTEAELFNMLSELLSNKNKVFSDKTRKASTVQQPKASTIEQPKAVTIETPKASTIEVKAEIKPTLVEPRNKNQEVIEKDVPEYIKLAKLLAKEPWLEKYLAK